MFNKSLIFKKEDTIKKKILLFGLVSIFLLSFFSPCFSEGKNNKIKTIKRQAYGFRDMEFFKLMLFGIHRTKYALVG